MTIFWRYWDTSFFTSQFSSRWDGPEKSCFPVPLGPDFLKLRIHKNLVFSRTRNFSKNRQIIIKKKFAGRRPAPSPYGAPPLPPNKVDAKCLAAVVLDNPDRALRLPIFLQLWAALGFCTNKAWGLSQGCRVMLRQRPLVPDGSSWILPLRVPPSSAAFSFFPCRFT